MHVVHANVVNVLNIFIITLLVTISHWNQSSLVRFIK